MKDKKTIRQRVEVLFGLPAMKMPWSLYMAQLNEAGKITAKSLLDMMTIILESLEEMEERIEELSAQPEPEAETPAEILDVVKPEEPKTTAEKVSKVTEEVVGEGIVVTKEETPESKPSE